MSGYADWLGRMPTDEIGYQTWIKEGQQHGWTNGHGDGRAIEIVPEPTQEPPPKAKRKTQVERLKEAVDEAGVEFFHDSEFRGYASFEREFHRETWAIKSSGFRRFVSWLMYRKTGKAARAADLADFIATVEGQAQFEGQLQSAYVRIAPADDGIVVDLGDPEWSVIDIDPDGWRHVDRPSARFVRPRGMLALPLPEHGGSIDELRPFLNVADDDAWRLVVGFMIMMFRPAGPYPVLGVHGEQGAAKSTAMRVLRKLIDPRETMDRAAPRNDHDLAISAMHNRVIALDNLSSLPDWLSDALSRLATGGGFSTRQLHSDADEFSFSAARPVMLNGIGEIIHRSDLLDRAVLVDLQPISEADRKLESQFWSDFDAARPRILGALLDAVAVAIRREPTMTRAIWPRMADFARWVTAAEPGLGWVDGSFLAAYFANRGSAHELALEADPIAVAVREMMATIDEWEGSASELLTRLADLAGDQATKRKDWPGAAHTLSNRLERLAPNLRAVDIEISRSKGTSGKRTIALSKVCKEAPLAPPPPLDEAAAERESGASGASGARSQGFNETSFDPETATDDDGEVPA